MDKREEALNKHIDHVVSESQEYFHLNAEITRLQSENAALRDALERTLNNFESILAQRPVRDATETIAEARAALAAGGK